MSEIIECNLCQRQPLSFDSKDVELAVSSCGHIFHKSCIDGLLAANSRASCPKCKKNVGSVTALRGIEHNTGAKTFKVVVVGDSLCGKTFLIHRYVKHEYALEGTFTPSKVFCRKAVLIGEEWVMMEIWDTAGSESFRNLIHLYAKDADGVILTYDKTSRQSLENTMVYRKLIENHTAPTAVTILVGCKKDKCKCTDSVCAREEIPVCYCPTPLEKEEMAKLFGIDHYQTSAKTGENVEMVFRLLTMQMLQTKFPDRRQSIPISRKALENDHSVHRSCVCQ